MQLQPSLKDLDHFVCLSSSVLCAASGAKAELPPTKREHTTNTIRTASSSRDEETESLQFEFVDYI
jgi:hypothetical protein